MTSNSKRVTGRKRNEKTNNWKTKLAVLRNVFVMKGLSNRADVCSGLFVIRLVQMLLRDNIMTDSWVGT